VQTNTKTLRKNEHEDIAEDAIEIDNILDVIFDNKEADEEL